MYIRVGNALYFSTIAVTLLILFLLWYLLKDSSARKCKTILLSIAFANFAVHFLKLLFPPYSAAIVSGAANTWPYSITNITFENICAVNTILLPFAILSKKQWFTDSVLLLSIVGGIAAIVYPVDMFTSGLPLLEVLRFYFCHMILIIVPTLVLSLKLHKYDFKSFWKLPLFFFAEEAGILLNNYLLMEIGVYPQREDFLVYEWHNTSFIYGPYFDATGKEELGFLSKLVPNFMKTIPNGFTYYSSKLGDNYDFGGQTKYWPLLWMICPLAVYGYPLSFGISCALDSKGLISLFKRGTSHE